MPQLIRILPLSHTGVSQFHPGTYPTAAGDCIPGSGEYAHYEMPGVQESPSKCIFLPESDFMHGASHTRALGSSMQ